MLGRILGSILLYSVSAAVGLSPAFALTFGDLVTNNTSIGFPNGLTFSNFSGNVSVDDTAATDGVTFSSLSPSLNSLIVSSGFSTGVHFGRVQNLFPPPEPQIGDVASINYSGISLAGTILHSKAAYPFTITYTLNYTVTGPVGPRLLVNRADVGGATKWEHVITSLNAPNFSVHNTWDPDNRTNVEQVGLGIGNRELRITDILVLSPFIELDGPAPDGTFFPCLTNATGCPFHVNGNGLFPAPAGFSTGFQTVQAVPESSAILLLVTGLVALWIVRRKEVSIEKSA